MERYDLTHDNTKIFIDASSPAVVMAVKKSLDDKEERYVSQSQGLDRL